jgi:hypothetical protein
MVCLSISATGPILRIYYESKVANFSGTLYNNDAVQ